MVRADESNYKDETSQTIQQGGLADALGTRPETVTQVLPI